MNSGLKPAPSSSSAAHAPRRRHLPAGRRQRAADDLQQRGLARSVAPDDADDLALCDVEGHVLQGAELPIELPSSAKQRLPQAVLRKVVDLVHLRQARHRHGGRPRRLRIRGLPRQALIALDDIRKSPPRLLEPPESQGRDQQILDRGEREPREIGQRLIREHRPRLFDDERQRIEADQEAVVLRAPRSSGTGSARGTTGSS